MVHITLPLQHSPCPWTASLLAVSSQAFARRAAEKEWGYVVPEALHPAVTGDAHSSR